MPQLDNRARASWQLLQRKRRAVSPQANDLVTTPLGVVVTVVGVQFEGNDTTKTATGRLVIRYPNGYEAALEPRPIGAPPLTEVGYKKASEADHILREIQSWRAERRAMEAEWARHSATMRLRTEALNLEGAARKLKGSSQRKGLAGTSRRPATARA